MNSLEKTDPRRERRLDEVVAAWLKAEEAGDKPDASEWLARHPDLAPELESFFAAEKQLGQIAAPWRDAATLNTPPAVNCLETETIDRGGDPRGRTPAAGREQGVPGLGRTIGEYELIAEIARGGMGVVYKARQTRLNRTVALKMILAGELAHQDDVRRFMAEAEAAAGLDHPGIVPVYESGEVEGQHFFSMGYVAGHSLAAALAAGPLPPRRAAELLVQVADAVDYAHRQGVIHRDLKPGNILLDQDDNPRVTDFGLAKRIAGDSGLTHTGQALGTPSYMPPEQAAGKLDAIGPVSDVYALGAVLYAMLTCRPPFQAANPLDTLLQVLQQEPVPPRQLNADVPADLETIALKCLEKEPHKRYATARELADELRRFLDGEPIHARPVGRAERVWRWCRRNPLAAVLASAAVLALMVGASVSTYFAFKAHHRAIDAERSATLAREAEGREKRQRVAAQTAEKKEKQQRLAAQTAQRREKDERLRAERQLRQATALRLAAQANDALPDWPQRATLLAMAAMNETMSAGEPRLAAAEQALRDSLATLSGRPLAVGDVTTVALGLDPTTGELLTLGDDRTVRSWNLDTGAAAPRSWKLPSVPRYDRNYAVFSPDGRWLASFGGGGAELHELLRDSSDGQAKAKSWRLPNMRGGTPFFQFTPDSRWLVGSNVVSSFQSGLNVWNLAAADPSAVAFTIAGSIFPVGFHSHVAMSGDSRWLAISSLVGVQQFAQLVDLHAPEPKQTIRRLQSQPVSMFRLAFSPNGRWLAASHEAQVVGGQLAAAGINVWDLTQAADAAPRTLVSKLASFQSLAFSNDARWLAAGAALGAEQFDLADAEKTPPAISLPGVRWNPTVAHVGFSHDDRWLVTVGAAGHVRLWDMRAADPAAVPLPLAENTSGVRHTMIGLDGRALVVVGGDNAIRLWNLADGNPPATAQVLRGQEDTTSDVLLSATGRWLVAGPRAPRRWDLQAAQAVGEPFAKRATSNRWTSARFSPNGRWLLTPEGSQPVVYDLSKPRPFEQPLKLPQPRLPNIGAFSMDGGRFAVHYSSDGSIHIWDLSHGSPIAEAGGAPPDQSAAPRSRALRFTSLAFSIDDRCLIAGTANKRRWLIDPARPSADPIPLAGTELAHSSDQRWLITAEQHGGGHRYDLSQSPPAENTFAFSPTGRRVEIAVLSPSGRRLFTVDGGNRAQLWRTDATDSPAIELGGAEDDPRQALFVPGTRWLAYVPAGAGEYSKLRLCDVESGDPTSSFIDLPGHTQGIEALAADAEGRRVATSARDGTLRVWNLTDLPKQAGSIALRPGDEPDHHLAVSPNGRWVAVGGAKQFAVQLWDVESGDVDRPVLLTGHASPLKAISFSSDGRWLLASSDGGQELRVWRVGMPELLDHAGLAAARKLTDDERANYHLERRRRPD